MNDEKFTYKEGEVQVSIPQCATCKHRQNGTCTIGNDIESAHKGECAGYEQEG